MNYFRDLEQAIPRILEVLRADQRHLFFKWWGQVVKDLSVWENIVKYLHHDCKEFFTMNWKEGFNIDPPTYLLANQINIKSEFIPKFPLRYFSNVERLKILVPTEEIKVFEYPYPFRKVYSLGVLKISDEISEHPILNNIQDLWVQIYEGEDLNAFPNLKLLHYEKSLWARGEIKDVFPHIQNIIEGR